MNLLGLYWEKSHPILIFLRSSLTKSHPKNLTPITTHMISLTKPYLETYLAIPCSWILRNPVSASITRNHIKQKSINPKSIIKIILNTLNIQWTFLNLNICDCFGILKNHYSYYEKKNCLQMSQIFKVRLNKELLQGAEDRMREKMEKNS